MVQRLASIYSINGIDDHLVINSHVKTDFLDIDVKMESWFIVC